ncbi:hypothetical protein [Novosphingobium sp. 9]|uniref:hypothetical protein n=1 Tax=Novosphingobium sp. 9 TaxID=2025349 RepID=UPI0021B55D5B|nr:hypothetical protein [Novosphingobium sp. 9]
MPADLIPPFSPWHKTLPPAQAPHLIEKGNPPWCDLASDLASDLGFDALRRLDSRLRGNDES